MAVNCSCATSECADHRKSGPQSIRRSINVSAEHHMPIVCAHTRQAALTGESGPVKLGGYFSPYFSLGCCGWLSLPVVTNCLVGLGLRNDLVRVERHVKLSRGLTSKRSAVCLQPRDSTWPRTSCITPLHHYAVHGHSRASTSVPIESPNDTSNWQPLAPFPSWSYNAVSVKFSLSTREYLSLIQLVPSTTDNQFNIGDGGGRWGGEITKFSLEGVMDTSRPVVYLLSSTDC